VSRISLATWRTVLPACNPLEENQDSSRFSPAIIALARLDRAVTLHAIAASFTTTRKLPMAEKKTCPSCQAALPANAVLCVECGYHLLSGKKLKTVSKRLTRVVGSNPATPGRIIVAVLLAVGGVGLIGFTVLVLTRDEDAPLWAFIVMGIALILGGCGVGSGSRTIATRSRKGHPELWQQFWVFFIPASSRRFDLREWDGVYFDFRAGDRNNPDIHILQLGRNHRDEFVTIYQGGNEQMCKDLGDAIKEVSGLRLERK
jgi:hypothetical protein